jgi:hypothetical protein
LRLEFEKWWRRERLFSQFFSNRFTDDFFQMVAVQFFFKEVCSEKKQFSWRTKKGDKIGKNTDIIVFRYFIVHKSTFFMMIKYSLMNPDARFFNDSGALTTRSKDVGITILAHSLIIPIFVTDKSPAGVWDESKDPVLCKSFGHDHIWPFRQLSLLISTCTHRN